MPYIGNPAVDRFTATKTASVYSGDGSTVAFTLEHSVGADEDILVSVDGVVQEPSVAYAVSSGTTLTFTAAPSTNAGNNIFVYYLFSTIGTVTHPATSALSATSGTFTGDIDVDGTTNLDVVDIDGAVDMASTLIVDGKVGLGIDPSTLPSFVNHAMKISNGGGLSITSPSAGDNRLIFFGTGTSSADVQLAAIKNTSSDFIFLGASGAERFKIHNNGVVAPLNGIALGVGTANTASNVLDDYEEGTWTCTVTGSSANPSTAVTEGGTYTKIGRMVYAHVQLSNKNTSGASGAVRITGLPFEAGADNQATGNLMTYVGVSMDVDASNISPYVGGTGASFYASKHNAGWAEITHNPVANFYLSFSVTYVV